ncbi:hypothetical protein KUTeg_008693 [Tegillarca granosa]|uniref:Inositol 2-dehydrogenase n=1 Tax=Tegillarca granosa TaxID=220873 RepID=A0ABQ9FCH0_TEGGR|nr:hypothetical protein KUTeg_008693 [Tegillarca granosa]
MSRLGIALFGVGRIGQVHLENLVFSNKVDIRWLVDVKEVHPGIQTASQQLRLGDETHITTPDDIDKVLSDKRVDVVLVCTITPTHEEIIRKALNAGKHVFCEKPLALTLEAVKKCYEEAEKCKKVLFCGLNRRFHDQLFAIYTKVKQGDLGQVRIVRMTSRDQHPPKNYLQNNRGGILFDMGIHDLDYICWLIGKRPLSVSAFGATSPESPDDYRELNENDSAVAILKFPDNIIAYCEVTHGSCYGYEQTVEPV